MQVEEVNAMRIKNIVLATGLAAMLSGCSGMNKVNEEKSISTPLPFRQTFVRDVTGEGIFESAVDWYIMSLCDKK